MRTILFLLSLTVSFTLHAQRFCATTEYVHEQTAQFPHLLKVQAQIEHFIKNQPSLNTQAFRTTGTEILKIPVVVHILYNSAEQNISDAQIKSQIEALNRDFRRLNNDTVNTPQRFKGIAADVEIEFYLATADPMGRSTNGIVRKKTNVASWSNDDKIKFSAQGGNNAWDSKSYLNIWVGKLTSGLGYSSPLGSDATKDGVVINASAFGTINTAYPYNLGRTAVHEIGHWLGLKHVWGDTYCGNDLVEDTPPQSGYTSGCPTTFRTSCSNGTTGDMYMNYMDFTYDACINLFTFGQKERMRSMFNTGGPRATLLKSKGLNEPWLEESSLPEPEFKEAVIYPNPAQNEVLVNFKGDASWIGKSIRLYNMNGVLLKTIIISTPLQKINLNELSKGVYFLKSENGEVRLFEKLIKI